MPCIDCELNIALAPRFDFTDNEEMRRRPWSLVILAILHFLAPIGNLILNALIVQESVLKYFVRAMSPEYLGQNWVIVVAPVVAGVSIYSCKKWSYYVYLFAITLLFIFSYTGYLSKSEAIGFFPILLVYIVNISVVSFFLLPAVRSIYFDRRMRWWEIQPRYKCNFQCEFTNLKGGESKLGQVGNISANGLFLRADEMPEDQDEIVVELPFDEGINLRFKGRVIVHNRVDAVGFGVQFIHTKESRAAAKELIDDLEIKGMRISTLDGRPEDSFTYWLRTLLTTGKGIIPSKKE